MGENCCRTVGFSSSWKLSLGLGVQGNSSAVVALQLKEGLMFGGLSAASFIAATESYHKCMCLLAEQGKGGGGRRRELTGARSQSAFSWKLLNPFSAAERLLGVLTWL